MTLIDTWEVLVLILVIYAVVAIVVGVFLLVRQARRRDDTSHT